MLNHFLISRICTGLVFCAILNFSEAQEVIVVDESKERDEKTALVVLNGFGDSKKNRKAQTAFFSSLKYDFFMPEFILRHSLEESVATFSEFYKDQNLDGYAEVKVMCYIIGGYVLNRHIEREGLGSITTIIYDRSPIQERAPRVAVDRMSLLAKIKFGKVLEQFASIENSPLKHSSNVQNLDIGLIIENKATRLMRFFHKAADKYGKCNFSPHQIDPNLDDYFHTILDHDEMYVRFDVIGEEIKHFLENDRFSDDARRERCDWDPFEKHKP
jgi:hypothetical protein